MKVLAFVCSLVLIASCFIDRRSNDLECTMQEQCTPSGKVCQDGFCVESDIALVCNGGFDPIDRTCTISCNSPSQCGIVRCPPDFTCTITCSASNACNNVDCSDAAECNVTCNANNACQDIECGAGRCNVQCAVGNACDVVSCAASCACDVTCATGACEDQECPMGSANQCTQDGTSATSCNSIVQAGCSTCP